MPKIGQLVSIPTGQYCNITLDSGEKIIVNYEQGGGGGTGSACLTVDRVKMFGLSSDRVFAIDLDAKTGKTALTALTRDGGGSALQRFVAYIQDCRSIAELTARCRQLVGAA